VRSLARVDDSARDEGLLSDREAAQRLGCGRYSIKKLIRSGELRAFRVNGMLRISPLDLRRYLQQHVATAEPGAFGGRPNQRQPTKDRARGAGETAGATRGHELSEHGMGPVEKEEAASVDQSVAADQGTGRSRPT
jgi:excisionase family DNA binding protein